MHRLTMLCGSLLLAVYAATASGAVPQPLAPTGRLISRSPVFKWTATGAGQYTVELTVDNASQQKTTVTAPKWIPASPFSAGVYQWRVKEGGVSSSSPWSSPLSFIIPPYSPDPLVPDSRLTPAPNTPVFGWENTDPLANRVTLQLYRNEDLIKSLTVTGTLVKPFNYETTWPDALPVGSYKWRMRSLRKHANPEFTLKSDWSDYIPFSVGVPRQPTITKPTLNAIHSPGRYILSLEWLRSEGATAYSAKILCNGVDLLAWPNYPTNAIKADQTWTPGHYVFLVRGLNAYGSGAWSAPRTFQISRDMTPGDNDSVYTTNAPRRLEWSRSWNATHYRVRLYRVDPATGEYALLKESSVPQTLNPPLLKVGTLTSGAYRWQVTDFDGDKALYTSTAYFSVNVPLRPTPLKPLGAVAGLYDVRFAWKTASGFPTHYQFRLMKNGVVIKDTGWKTAAALTKAIDLTRTYTLTSSGPGTYRWRVRAKNAAGPGG